MDFILEDDQVCVEDKDLLSTVATLLNSTIEEVEKSLLYRIVAARGEVMEKGHSLDDAYYGRDALCKVWQEHSNSERPTPLHLKH